MKFTSIVTILALATGIIANPVPVAEPEAAPEAAPAALPEPEAAPEAEPRLVARTYHHYQCPWGYEGYWHRRKFYCKKKHHHYNGGYNKYKNYNNKHY